ncbi:ABC transporter permease [Dongia deserti]|uniref:ABC transporter permease n=1 Tax=Dongia deserti TaxID=2268030 RepID=UPI000E65534D|nr:ABC transporter permease [Dongia deserti]
MSTLDADYRNGGGATRHAWHLGRQIVHNPGLTASLAFLVLIVGLAILAPLLPYDAYRQDVLHRNELPTLQHWLGTDELGRDVLARIAVGARVSLVVAVATTLIAIAIGVMVGTISAYLGGVTDSIVMRFVDSMYAFPETLFAILMAALVKGQLSGEANGFLAPLVEAYRLSGGMLGVLLTLGLTGWLTTSRLVRSQVLSLKHAEYVLACRLSGASDWFIIRTHLLPNTIPVILVAVTLVVPNAILLEAGLSFIGIGVDPPTPSWGTMIATGAQSIQSYPHLLICPALAIGLTLLSLNVIGDALRDIFDPALAGAQKA